MNSRNKIFMTLLVISGALGFSTYAVATPDTGAARITLKLTCETGNNNCFDTDVATTNGSIADMLTWMWVTRDPSVADPLIVDIDPGTYLLPNNALFCKDDGNVTVRGSGIDNTVLSGGGQTPNLSVVDIENCTNLSFQDLTIRTDTRSGSSGSQNGIFWVGGGNSTWTNIQVQASGYGWGDNQCAGSSHYWFSSKIDTVNTTGAYVAAAYYTNCGETWFYGGELQAVNDGANQQGLMGVNAFGTGDVRIFGSAVRVHTTAGTTQTTGSFFGQAGLLATNAGKIHMHGGIVSVTSDGTANQDVIGVGVGTAFVFGGGFIHTPDTAFSLKPSGTGVAQRIAIKNGSIGGPFEIPDGTVDSPFLWSAGGNPPQPNGNSLQSSNGQDVFVETDCDSAGDCTGVGTETHLMLYNNNCITDGPWFDSTRGKCRGAP